MARGRESSGSDSSRRMRAEAQADRGMRHLAAKRFGNAAVCFGRAVQLDEDNAGHRVGRALASRALDGDYEAAMADLVQSHRIGA